MEERGTYIAQSSGKTIPVISGAGGDKYTSQVVSTIVSEGDPIGAVILLSTDPEISMGEAEEKLAQSAAGFLGRHMEQ